MKRLVGLLFVSLLLASVNVRAQEAAAVQLPAAKKIKLSNGMTILLAEQHEVPIVSFNLRVRAGSVLDPAGKEGAAAMTGDLLRKGTKRRTASQIASELDFIGGKFDVVTNYDASIVAAEFLKKDTAKGLDIFSDLIINPTFPGDEFTKMQRQYADSVLSNKDQAQAVIGNYFNAYLYGKQHVYARPVSGDERSLSSITADDIRRFYDATYAPSNMILAVVGDFDAAEMERMLTTAFGTWNKAAQPQTAIAAAQPVTGKRLLLIDKPDSTQTFYTIGNLGINRTNQDRVGIALVNTLFGGRFTSLLNSELRIKSGLTYGARSSFDRRAQTGTFAISTYTRNETTEKAIDLTLDVLNRLHTQGITAEQLASAKAYLKGQFPVSIETSDQIAAQLTELEFYGLAATEINDYYKRIDALTLADATRIIKTYFPINDYVLVLIGKRSEIEKLARKYAAQVDFKSISEAGF